MSKFISAVLAGAMLAGSAFAAFAGEGEGVVANVDEATRTIMRSCPVIAPWIPSR